MTEENDEALNSRLSSEEIRKIETLNRMSQDMEGSNPQLALSYARQALNLSKEAGYHKGIAYSLLMKGIVCERLSEYDEGMAALFEAVLLFRELGDKPGEARALNSIGTYYFFLSKFQDAMDTFQSSLKLAREIGFEIIEVRSLNNIGEIYREFGKFKEALTYYDSGLKIAEKGGDSLILGTLLMNIGHLKYSLGHLMEASKSYKKSIRIFRDINEKLFEAESLNKLGEIYLDYGKYDAALKYFQSSLYICRAQENKYLEISVLQSLSKADALRKRYDEALKFLQTALDLAKEIQANKLTAEVHLGLAAINEETGDYKTSVGHYKEYNKIMKDVTTLEFEKKLHAASVQFKLEQAQAEAEIYRLKNIELKQKAEIIEANALELEKSYMNMYIISEIGRKITSSLDLEKILNTLYESVNSLMDASCFGVGIYHGRKGIIEYKLFIDKSLRLPVSYKPVTSEESLAAWCIRNCKELLCNDLAAEYHKFITHMDAGTLEKTAKSVIYCPLVIKDEVIGVITVQSYETNAYSEYNLTTIKALASYVSIALNNSAKSEEIKEKAVLLAREIAIRKNAQSSLEKANQKLETLLSVDVLTGISNRRSFERFAKQLWKNAEANFQPLSFMLIDIDNFKQYNDTYGHLEGDKCLRKVGLCLQESVRKPEDIAARYGGDEFVVILPTIDSEEALVIAERLRTKVEDLKINHKDPSVSKYVTVSIGISSAVPNRNLSVKQLLVYADNALYQAKNSGRNCVRCMNITGQTESLAAK